MNSRVNCRPTQDPAGRMSDREYENFLQLWPDYDPSPEPWYEAPLEFLGIMSFLGVCAGAIFGVSALISNYRESPKPQVSVPICSPLEQKLEESKSK